MDPFMNTTLAYLDQHTRSIRPFQFGNYYAWGLNLRAMHFPLCNMTFLTSTFANGIWAKLLAVLQSSSMGRDMELLPLSHPHIFSSLMLYCSPATLVSCRQICPTWTSWFSSACARVVWARALRREAGRAKRLAWSVRYDALPVNNGWQVNIYVQVYKTLNFFFF